MVTRAPPIQYRGGGKVAAVQWQRARQCRARLVNRKGEKGVAAERSMVRGVLVMGHGRCDAQVALHGVLCFSLLSMRQSINALGAINKKKKYLVLHLQLVVRWKLTLVSGEHDHLTMLSKISIFSCHGCKIGNLTKKRSRFLKSMNTDSHLNTISGYQEILRTRKGG